MKLVWIDYYQNNIGQITRYGIYRKMCRHCGDPFYVTGSMNPEAKKNGNFNLVNCEKHRRSKVVFSGKNTTNDGDGLSIGDFGSNLKKGETNA